MAEDHPEYEGGKCEVELAEARGTRVLEVSILEKDSLEVLRPRFHHKLTCFVLNYIKAKIAAS
jgi:hypothetical protein